MQGQLRCFSSSASTTTRNSDLPCLAQLLSNFFVLIIFIFHARHYIHHHDQLFSIYHSHLSYSIPLLTLNLGVCQRLTLFAAIPHSSLSGKQRLEAVIKTAFADFQTSRLEYAILAGFNEALMWLGTGYLQEIHIHCQMTGM